MTDRSKQALIGHIYADAVTRMVPSEPMIVTKHPIENGTIISEHIAEDGMTLELDCVFTDDVYTVQTDGLVSVYATTTADDKRKAIYQLKRDRKIITIETIKERYDSMALIDIEEEVTPQNAKAFVCTLHFEKVLTATTRQTTMTLDRIKKKPALKKQAALKQEPTEDQGQQSTEDIGDDPQAAAAVDGLLGALGVEAETGT